MQHGDFAPTAIAPQVLDGIKRHRYLPDITPQKKSVLHAVGKFLATKWQLLLAAVVVVGALAFAFKQIKNDYANTDKALTQGNVLVVPHQK